MDKEVLNEALNRANMAATNSRRGIILPEYRKLSVLRRKTRTTLKK